MMKRIIIVAAVVALVSSSAMAASLVVIQPLGTAVSSQGRAITNDGKYVTGFGPGTTADRAFLWTAAGGTQGPILSGSFMSEGTGVGYRTNPTTLAKELLIGGKQSSGQVGMFRSTDNGVTWTRPLQSAGTGPGTAATNSVGGNAVGSADYAYMGWTDSGVPTGNYLGSVWGDPIQSAIAFKNNSGTQTAYSNGMSNTGRMVGARKNNAGARQNVYQVGGTQTMFNGLDGTTVGIASSVSGDGTKIFGQSPIVGSGTTNYPYMKNVVSGAITALPLLPGTAGSTSLGYPYGASENGLWAVGMDYRGMEKAALWNMNSGHVLDLTVYANANGILDGFTGNLRRGYSVGVNELGQPVITGMGVYYAPGSTVALTRGFVMTLDIPEPGTMAFLVLGGLALLRRRR